jgi:hypothetical protein
MLLAVAMGTQATLGDTGVALVGGDPCALVEGVPTSGDPLRKSPRVRSAFAALEQAGAEAKALARAHGKLRAALAGLLGEAETVFRVARGADGASKPYNDARRSKARAWLERWVIRPGAPLRVGEFGFEPAPGLRAALMLAACRGGDREAAIAYGRRARGDDEGQARAFAALLLLAGGRDDEARELRDTLGDRGFLAAFVGAYLATDADAVRRLAATAHRRVTTPAQQDAARAQATRLGVGPP